MTAGLAEPVRLAAAAAKPVRIKNIEIFPIEIPIPREELQMGKYARYTFYEVETDVGVRGYCFDRGAEYRVLDKLIRPALVGKDLFAIEQHLKAGLGQWGGLEEAIWDAIGKIAGQPLHRLLGGSKSRLKVYLTCVWRGQSGSVASALQRPGGDGPEAQEGWLQRDEDPGLAARPTGDADACGEIRAAVGPDFSIMVDRNVGPNGMLWNYATRSESGPRAGEAQRRLARRAVRARRFVSPRPSSRAKWIS